MKPNEITDIKPMINKGNYDHSTFLGKYHYDDVIIKVKSMPKEILEFNQLQDLHLIMHNDRHYKYLCNDNVKCEIIIIYPVLEEDYNKYFKKRKRIIETIEMYRNVTYPKIIMQDLSWIDNIISGKKESEDIIYNDGHVILLPDLKWSSGKIEDLYYLIIFKDKQLRSIRDLNQNHLQLLNNVKAICTNIISEKHNISVDQFRIYFHYHPSFWQLHLHVNLITNPWYGALADYAHLLSTVCNNIEMMNDYYQKSSLEISTCNTDKEIIVENKC